MTTNQPVLAPALTVRRKLLKSFGFGIAAALLLRT